MVVGVEKSTFLSTADWSKPIYLTIRLQGNEVSHRFICSKQGLSLKMMYEEKKRSFKSGEPIYLLEFSGDTQTSFLLLFSNIVIGSFNLSVVSAEVG